MPIFQIRNKKLEAVKEKKFDLEKDLQTLVEGNLQSLFNLRLITSEFNIEGFYIDTLAYDPETNSLVIIEYKKDQSFSVVDQGLHYLQLMLSHKADFVLEINEKLGKNFNKGSIDWSQPRVMFLAKNFTDYQIGSTGFKNFPIELWQVSIYENNLINFNLIQVAREVESITKITKDKRVQRVVGEVRESTLEDHLKWGSELTKQMFLDLREDILQRFESVAENPTVNYFGFRFHGTNFAALRMRKDKVTIDIRINKPKENKISIRKKPPSAWDTTPSWRFEIRNKSEMRQAMDYIEQAYAYYESKFS